MTLCRKRGVCGGVSCLVTITWKQKAVLPRRASLETLVAGRWWWDLPWKEETLSTAVVLFWHHPRTQERECCTSCCYLARNISLGFPLGLCCLVGVAIALSVCLDSNNCLQVFNFPFSFFLFSFFCTYSSFFCSKFGI